ncbi:o-succinylbenzoate synthase [Agromyces archimandritae]|uniref:o-succinylbenzoate synthase n=1 Tax=Agromyces archimandritae TaxID=2781962 RepID=A0A975FRI7_9MICO|nr:o-succinylbenzoate synthase [Agromyces archimandritae]QTX05911.1 o-succinylbenzoate synthase [Agromyces archimandritae]
MRITRIELHEVRLPLVHGFETSSHRKTSLTHILVEAHDASGVVGWGEIASPSGPYFTSETNETAWEVGNRYLAPAVLGTEWGYPDELEAAWAKIRGHEFAKAGFAGAAWDLWSRAEGVPLARALGATRTEVEAGVSLGIEPTFDELLAQVQRQVDAGYGRVKLKIAPGWDVEPVRLVREAFPDLVLHVDANGVYRSDDETMAHLSSLDADGLAMIEQPFAPRDFTGHARFQSRIETPVCLDESVVALDDLRTMLALDAGRVLNIKVSRMGGPGVARAAHDLARDAGVPVWCGGMHEFGIGRAVNVAVSALPGFSYPSDVSGSDKYYARDIVTPPIVAHGGIVQVPTTPGIGHEVDAGFLAEQRLRHARVDAAGEAAAGAAPAAAPTDAAAAAAPTDGGAAPDGRPAASTPRIVVVMVDDLAEGVPPVAAEFREVDPAEPQLSVQDLGPTRGDGVFETVGVKGGRLFALGPHLARFAKSARMLELPAPKLEVWERAIRHAVAAHGGEDIAAKFVMTRGIEGTGVPVGWVTVFESGDFARPRTEGVSVVTLDRGYRSDVAETSPWLLQGAKSLSYAVNKAVLREAARRDAEDVIFVSSDGYVLEGPSSTVLMRFGDEFVTPAARQGILEGTTLGTAIAFLAGEGFEVRHEQVPVSRLADAEGLWLLSSTRRAAPINRLDGEARPVDRDLTERLQSALADAPEGIG